MNAALLPLPDNLSPDVNKHEKPQYNYPQLVTKGTSGDLKTGRGTKHKAREGERRQGHGLLLRCCHLGEAWEDL